MRVNAAMGVIAVSCVVAVVNGANLSGVGRLHQKTHRTTPHVRRFAAMEFADIQASHDEPPPPLQISAPKAHSGGLVRFPDFTRDSPPDAIEPPPEPVYFNAPLPIVFGGLAPPPKSESPTPPQPPPPLEPPPVTFRILQATAIPEPSTWAMLAVGVGLIGAMLRRRRRDTAGHWWLGHGHAR